MNDKPNNDGIDRRNFLRCMAWAGTGLVWTMSGGVPTSRLFAANIHEASARGSFSFAQISDSHIGFKKAANQDVTGTLKLALDKINRLPVTPDLLLHTGDISHSSGAAEFDTAQQLIQGVKTGQVFYVPGEHDTATDDGVLYRER
jgi:Icc protein